MRTLSPEDLKAIEAAVRTAEARTTGEIYCVVTPESSHYAETPIAWAAGVALLPQRWVYPVYAVVRGMNTGKRIPAHSSALGQARGTTIS